MRYGPRQPLNRGSNKLVPTNVVSSINLSHLREDFETITGFSASIGAYPSLGADKLRLSLLGREEETDSDNRGSRSRRTIMIVISLLLQNYGHPLTAAPTPSPCVHERLRAVSSGLSCLLSASVPAGEACG